MGDLSARSIKRFQIVDTASGILYSEEPRYYMYITVRYCMYTHVRAHIWV